MHFEIRARRGRFNLEEQLVVFLRRSFLMEEMLRRAEGRTKKAYAVVVALMIALAVFAGVYPFI